jgi:hypothetical protein
MGRIRGERALETVMRRLGGIVPFVGDQVKGSCQRDSKQKEGEVEVTKRRVERALECMEQSCKSTGRRTISIRSPLFFPSLRIFSICCNLLILFLLTLVPALVSALHEDTLLEVIFDPLVREIHANEDQFASSLSCPLRDLPIIANLAIEEHMDALNYKLLIVSFHRQDPYAIVFSGGGKETSYL